MNNKLILHNIGDIDLSFPLIGKSFKAYTPLILVSVIYLLLVDLFERKFMLMLNNFLVIFSRDCSGWTATINVDSVAVDTVFADNLASLSYLLSGRLTTLEHTATVNEVNLHSVPTLW